MDAATGFPTDVGVAVKIGEPAVDVSVCGVISYIGGVVTEGLGMPPVVMASGDAVLGSVSRLEETPGLASVASVPDDEDEVAV